MGGGTQVPAELGAGDQNAPRSDSLSPATPAHRPRLFNFDAQGLRVVGTQEAPWFVAKDVCAALGLPNVSLAISGRADRDESGLDEDEKGIAIVNTLGGPQEMLTVNESGLYCLIFRSRKPEARTFRKWVTAEVLPALRRTGRYVVAPTSIAALLPPPPSGTIPDLATRHAALLLEFLLGDQRLAVWRFSAIVPVAIGNQLFPWAITQADSRSELASFARHLARLHGRLFPLVDGASAELAAVGQARHRKYVIVRHEGGAS